VAVLVRPLPAAAAALPLPPLQTAKEGDYPHPTPFSSS
jgi:hypothetical protein